MEDPILPVQMI